MQNKSDQLRTYEVNKISWSCYDEKQCHLDDEIKTLAHRVD